MFEELNIKNNKKLMKILYQCLLDLDNWKLINITNNINKNNIDKNTIIIIDRIIFKDKYTLVFASEIEKILSYKCDIRAKRTLLYIYVLIVSRIDDKGYCFPRYDTFERDLQTTSRNRIINAIQILKDIDLIDFANVGVIKDSKKIYQANNIYVTTITEGYKEILSSALEDSKKYFINTDTDILKNKKKDKDKPKETDKDNGNVEYQKVINYKYSQVENQILVKKVKHNVRNDERDKAKKGYKKLVERYLKEINESA
jgi:hypothetical protein